MVQPLRKSVWQFLQKLNIELLCDSSVLLLGIYPKELKAGTERDICTTRFIAALFTIAKIEKKPKGPSMDEWINKCVVLYTYKEYNSALKRKKILTHATTWTNLEDVILNEINLSQKEKALYDSTYMRCLD